jgi:hypothetical protein
MLFYVQVASVCRGDVASENCAIQLYDFIIVRRGSSGEGSLGHVIYRQLTE